MLNKLLGRTEGHSPQGADYREAIRNADRTEPPAGLLQSVADKVKKLPLDVAAKSAKRANDRVVIAEGNVERANIALEQVIKDNAEREALCRGDLARREAALKEATDDLVKAQLHFISEAREQGALERTGPLMAFLSGADERADDVVPTVRVDHAEG